MFKDFSCDKYAKSYKSGRGNILFHSLVDWHFKVYPSSRKIGFHVVFMALTRSIKIKASAFKDKMYLY